MAESAVVASSDGDDDALLAYFAELLVPETGDSSSETPEDFSDVLGHDLELISNPRTETDELANIAVAAAHGVFTKDNLDRLTALIAVVRDWRAVRGHLLLLGLSVYTEFSEEDKWLAAALSLAFTVKGPNSRYGDDIRTFCSTHAERLRKALLADYALRWDARTMMPDSEA